MVYLLSFVQIQHKESLFVHMRLPRGFYPLSHYFLITGLKTALSPISHTWYALWMAYSSPFSRKSVDRGLILGLPSATSLTVQCICTFKTRCCTIYPDNGRINGLVSWTNSEGIYSRGWSTILLKLKSFFWGSVAPWITSITGKSNSSNTSTCIQVHVSTGTCRYNLE